MAVSLVVTPYELKSADPFSTKPPAVKCIPTKIWEKIFPHLTFRDQAKTLLVCRRWQREFLPLHVGASWQALSTLLQHVERALNNVPELKNELQTLIRKVQNTDLSLLQSSFKRDHLVPMLFSFLQVCAKSPNNPLGDVDPNLLQIIHLAIGVQGFQKLAHYLSHAYTVCTALEEQECTSELLNLSSQAMLHFYTGQTAQFRGYSPVSPAQRLVQLVRNEFGNILHDVRSSRDLAFRQLIGELGTRISGAHLPPRDKLQKIVSVMTYFPDNCLPVVCELIPKQLSPHDAQFALSYIFANGSMERFQREQFLQLAKRVAELSDCEQKVCTQAQIVIGGARWLPNGELEDVLRMAFMLKESDFSQNAIIEVAARLFRSSDVDYQYRLLELSKKLTAPARKLSLLCRLSLAKLSDEKFEQVLKALTELLFQYRDHPDIVQRWSQFCQQTSNFLAVHNFERAKKIFSLLEVSQPNQQVEEELSLFKMLREVYKTGVPRELFNLAQQFKLTHDESRKDLILYNMCLFIASRSCIQVLEDTKGDVEKLLPLLTLFREIATMVIEVETEGKAFYTLLNILSHRLNGTASTEQSCIICGQLLPLEQEVKDDILRAISVYLSQQEMLKAVLYASGMQNIARRGIMFAELILHDPDADPDTVRLLSEALEQISDVSQRDECVTNLLERLLAEVECNYIPESCFLATALSTKKERVAQFGKLLNHAESNNYLDDYFVKELSHLAPCVKKLAGVPDADVQEQFWEELVQAAAANLHVTIALNLLEAITNPAKKEALTAEIFSITEKKS